MGMKILKSILSNIKIFLGLWALIILANQIFIFGACFAPYCLIAALPHTFVIAALTQYLLTKANLKQPQQPFQNGLNASERSKLVPRDRTVHRERNTVNGTQEEVFCPRCGSGMTLRRARKGRYAGQKFLGCNLFPDCNGIINIQSSGQGDVQRLD